jgi:ABC-type multidrug transport system ATPase subunit
MFIEEVMELVELKPLRNALVGLPGVNGLSTEQRKRLTIAVELVANPSIIFMDEPTSGLDARAAAIVMRTVRNTVDTGRTVVCTIHQPSIDIFEAFDEVNLWWIFVLSYDFFLPLLFIWVTRLILKSN